jgi:hypothetical protein
MVLYVCVHLNEGTAKLIEADSEREAFKKSLRWQHSFDDPADSFVIALVNGWTPDEVRAKEILNS